MKCKDCKFWEPISDGKQGPCLRIDGLDGQDDDYFRTDLPDGTLAQAQANYGHTGVWLQTAPDFGCVLFEKRQLGAS
jgi:hypothetical protein